MMKSKILICGLSNVLGGVEIYSLNLASNIDKEKFEVSFLLNGDDEISYLDRINALGINYIRIPSLAKKDYFKRIKSIKNLLKNNKFDIIYYNSSFLHRLELLIYSKRYRVPCRIIHSHSSNYGYIPRGIILKLESYYKKHLKNYATDLIACSETAGNFTFGKNEFIVVHNGINLKSFQFSMEKRNEIRDELNLTDNIIIGHVGRLIDSKNPLYLIDILNQLVKTNKNYHMIHIGEIEDKILYDAFIKRINKYNLDKNITVLGKINNVIDYLNAFDFFLLPSLYEGYPISAVEAQANGVFCIVSSNIDKNIKLIDNCHFLDIQSPPELWSTFISNQEVNMTKRGLYNLELYQNGYDLENMLNKITNIIEKRMKKYEIKNTL